MIKNVSLILAILCILLIPVSDIYAHKVQMFAYAEGDTVFVEGYFADGKKAMKSEVTVYDKSGSELLRGRTDDSGQFKFKVPEKTDLRIVVDAGMGHKTEYTLPAGELKIADGNKATAPASKVNKSKNVKEEKIKDEKSEVSQFSRLDDAQLQAIVEKAVERSVGEAIKPLVRSFTEMQQKNQLTTIIGGIGYILGLMGIVLYFKSRRSS